MDRFYDVFEVGQVYTITNASVKLANRRFSNVKNDYELSLENGTQVTHVPNATAVPTVRFAFVPISNLGQTQKDDMIDIIGVAHDVGDLGNITVKSTGKQLSKRDITLVDKTAHGVRITLWGKEAEEFVDYKNRAVLAVKGARVSDYNGRTLSATMSSTLSLNPDIPEAHELRGWYDNTGYSQSPTMVSVTGGGAMAASLGGASRDERKLIAQIKEENMGGSEKGDYCNIVATVTFIKADGTFCYTACPSEGCNKKVLEDGPNMYRCERCQKVFERCEYRYILSLQVSDESGQTWLNVFNETGVSLLGMPAEELHRLKLDDEEDFKKVFERASLQTYLFKLRVKQEYYNGEMKIRNTVITALPCNYAEESKRLADKIDQVL